MKNKINKMIIFLFVLTITMSFYLFKSILWDGKNEHFSQYRETKSSTEIEQIMEVDENLNLNRDIASTREEGPIKKVVLDKTSPFLKRKNLGEIKDPVIQSRIKIDDSSDDLFGDETNYQLIKNIYAVEKAIYQNNMGDILDDVPGYYFVESSVEIPEAQRLVTKDDSKRFLIFTGLIKIKLTNFDDLYQLELDAPFEVVKTYDYMNRALLKFSKYQETIDSYHKLLSMKNIEDVSIELLDYSRTER